MEMTEFRAVCDWSRGLWCFYYMHNFPFIDPRLAGSVRIAMTFPCLLRDLMLVLVQRPVG